jgi:hypothetical protein
MEHGWLPVAVWKGIALRRFRQGRRNRGGDRCTAATATVTVASGATVLVLRLLGAVVGIRVADAVDPGKEIDSGQFAGVSRRGRE